MTEIDRLREAAQAVVDEHHGQVNREPGAGGDSSTVWHYDIHALHVRIQALRAALASHPTPSGACVDCGGDHPSGHPWHTPPTPSGTPDPHDEAEMAWITAHDLAAGATPSGTPDRERDTHHSGCCRHDGPGCPPSDPPLGEDHVRGSRSCCGTPDRERLAALVLDATQNIPSMYSDGDPRSDHEWALDAADRLLAAGVHPAAPSLDVEVEYRTPQGIIDNWRKQTKAELIDALCVYHEGMAELQREAAPSLDVEALREALDKYVMPLRGLDIPVGAIAREYQRIMVDKA